MRFLLALCFLAPPSAASEPAACPPLERWRDTYQAARRECSSAAQKAGPSAAKLAAGVRKSLEEARTALESALEPFREFDRACAKDRKACGDGAAAVAPVEDSFRAIAAGVAAAARAAAEAERSCGRASLGGCADRLGSAFAEERKVLLDSAPELKARIDRLEERKAGEIAETMRVRLEGLVPQSRAASESLRESLGRNWCDRGPCERSPEGDSCLKSYGSYAQAAARARDSAERTAAGRAESRRVDSSVAPFAGAMEKAASAAADPRSNGGRGALEWLRGLAEAAGARGADAFAAADAAAFCSEARPAEAAPESGAGSCASAPLSPECQAYCRDNPEEFACVLPNTCAAQPDLDQCRPSKAPPP